MKQYEEVAWYKKQLGWLGNKRNGRFNNVENLKRDLIRVQKEHEIIEKSYIDEIKLQQEDLDKLETLLADMKAKYKRVLNQEIKEPSKKPAPKKEVEKDDDGKVACSICGEFYAPQGIRSHEVACKRKRLEEELALLGD